MRQLVLCASHTAAERIFIEKLTSQSIKDINDSAALCQLLSGWLLNTNTTSSNKPNAKFS